MAAGLARRSRSRSRVVVGSLVVQEHSRRLAVRSPTSSRHGGEVSADQPPRRFSLANKTVVFTGSLASMSRSTAEAYARESGAHVASRVTAKTDLLVAGANAGAAFRKARGLGVAVLDEGQFRRLIGLGA